MKDKIYYSFDNLTKDLHTLVNKISYDNWKPDVIIGPGRGSYIPGVMLSHFYKIPFQGFIWQTRDGTTKDVTSLRDILIQNYDKKILLIDDINDTGETLIGIQNIVKNQIHNSDYNKYDIRFAVLFSKSSSKFSGIDYYVNLLKSDYDPWIVFPYEEW